MLSFQKMNCQLVQVVMAPPTRLLVPGARGVGVDLRPDGRGVVQASVSVMRGFSHEYWVVKSAWNRARSVAPGQTTGFVSAGNTSRQVQASEFASRGHTGLGEHVAEVEGDGAG